MGLPWRSIIVEQSTKPQKSSNNDLGAANSSSSRSSLSCPQNFLGSRPQKIAWHTTMPSADVLERLQALYLADDLEVPESALAWTEEEAHTFFDSGGLKRPAPAPSPNQHFAFGMATFEIIAIFKRPKNRDDGFDFDDSCTNSIVST